MSDGDAYSGAEPVTAPGVHDMPRSSIAAQLTNRQMKRFATAFVNQILATIFYALSGIKIFNAHPFSFLRAWADDLVQKANDAYSGAADAQDTAYTALQVLTLQNRRVQDDFDRPNSNDLGDDYEQAYTSGSGRLGIRDGDAVWISDGGGTRFCWARRRDELDSDNQVATVVIDKNIPGPGYSNWPRFYILLRVKSVEPGDFVFARIAHDHVRIGISVDDDIIASLEDDASGLTDVPIGSSKGVWEFRAGTDAGDRNFVLIHDGVTVMSATDTDELSGIGIDYRRGGFGMFAGNRIENFIFVQRGPGRIKAFSLDTAA